MSTLNFINMKVNTKMYLYLIPLALLLLIGNCSKDFTGINGNNNDIPCPVPTDTTSHEFTWVVDTLGDYGSSLKDVAIISENEVWVVGEIVINQPSYNLYGAAIWDGNEWIFRKIIVDSLNIKAQGILAFSKDNIWYAAGSIVHWDGQTAELSYLRDISSGEFLTKLWGTSSENLYGIGKDGIIVHYNGSTWTHQTSGTTRDLNDIAGFTDPETGKTRIWIAGTQMLLYSDNGENWQVILDENSLMLPEGYVNPTSLYLTDICYLYLTIWGSSGTGLFRLNQQKKNELSLITAHDVFVRSTTGQNINDLFMAGNYNNAVHFNGTGNLNYPELQGDGFFHSVKMRENMVYIVGSTGASWQGVVARGYR